MTLHKAHLTSAAAKSTVDFSSISFPSDQLTIGAIRELFSGSHLFAEDNNPLQAKPHLDSPIWAMLRDERVFATRAIANIARDKSQNDDLRYSLIREYIRFKLAENKPAAEKLLAQLAKSVQRRFNNADRRRSASGIEDKRFA